MIRGLIRGRGRAKRSEKMDGGTRDRPLGRELTYGGNLSQGADYVTRKRESAASVFDPECAARVTSRLISIKQRKAADHVCRSVLAESAARAAYNALITLEIDTNPMNYSSRHRRRFVHIFMWRVIAERIANARPSYWLRSDPGRGADRGFPVKSRGSKGSRITLRSSVAELSISISFRINITRSETVRRIFVRRNKRRVRHR